MEKYSKCHFGFNSENISGEDKVKYHNRLYSSIRGTCDKEENRRALDDSCRFENKHDLDACLLRANNCNQKKYKSRESISVFQSFLKWLKNE